MRALLLATLAAVAVVGLAGCGQDGTPAGAKSSEKASEKPSTASTGPSVTAPVPPLSTSIQRPPEPKPPAGATPTPPVTMGPNGPVVPPGVTQVPAARVDVSALPAYYEHRGDVWVYDDGYSLEMLAAASSGCSEAEAVVVDQTPEAVRIMLRPLAQTQGGRPDSRPCTAVMTPRPVTVRLREPLGDRTVYLGIGR
jgi:predicted small lipoprotein YifL